MPQLAQPVLANTVLAGGMLVIPNNLFWYRRLVSGFVPLRLAAQGWQNTSRDDDLK